MEKKYYKIKHHPFVCAWCINLARIMQKVIYVSQSVGFNNGDNNLRNTWPVRACV